MYRRGDKEFILDMVLACKNILDYTKGMDFERFVKDRRTVDAVIRNIEILGEAVKNISKSFQERYPNVEWRAIAKTRDKLIHFYFGVDVDVVWKIVSRDIPELLRELICIVRNEGWEDEIPD